MGDGDITGLPNQAAGPLVPGTADIVASVPVPAAGIRSEAVVAGEVARDAAKLLAALTHTDPSVPVIVSLQAKSWPHEVAAPLRLDLPTLRLADDNTFNLVYIDDRARSVYKIFRLEDYAVYVGELLWSVVVEKMGIMAPGVLRASRFYEGANGNRHPLPVYQMAQTFMPDEGWRKIVYPHRKPLRTKIFKELTNYSLPLLHIILDNVRALYATFYANGIAQVDKVQFFFNVRTGEVAFMDYGSLEIFSPTLYNRAVSDGFVKRDAAVFTMTRPVDEDLKFVLCMLEEAIRLAVKKVVPSAPVSRREGSVIVQSPMVSGAESMVAAGDSLLVAEDAGVVEAQLMAPTEDQEPPSVVDNQPSTDGKVGEDQEPLSTVDSRPSTAAVGLVTHPGTSALVRPALARLVVGH